MPAERPPNRLAREKSPYLLQHAHNPVDWFPWGDEAFARARAEDKPVLVSVGYSTCHWCHVMERESYEDEATAALMNQHLINIKVDREERPDLDKVFITAVSAMTGSAGWPLNVFLTPGGEPFFGGTYFPPSPRWGQPAWTDVVQHIGRAWKVPDERQNILASGAQLMDALRSMAQHSGSAASAVSADLLKAGYLELSAAFDPRRGGFGGAPKFPMPVYGFFLLRYHRRTGDAKALAMVEQTLREMSAGGIYDHLDGGFARYSTDADWFLPHFEKMLYDNSLLARLYTESWWTTRDPALKRVATETLDYLRRRLTHPDGGLFSAEDADSLPDAASHEKVEGAFYVWERESLRRLLTTEEFDAFCFRFGVRDGGNVARDPHGEFKNKNVLYAAHSVQETARRFGLATDDADRLLSSAALKLRQVRDRRPRPHLDDKVITAWNAMAISAFASAHQAWGEGDWLQAAQRAARFIEARLFDADSKTLYRSWREGVRSGPGMADDYAGMLQALVDLYEADFDADHLKWAETLAGELLVRFLDRGSGILYMTAEGQDPLAPLRVHDERDGVEPAAASVAAFSLLRLSHLLDRPEWAEAADRILQGASGRLRESPSSLAYMLCAVDFATVAPRQIVIVGEPGSEAVQCMMAALRHPFLPVKTALFAGGPMRRWLEERLPRLREMRAGAGHAAAYVCLGAHCEAPIHFASTLQERLSALAGTTAKHP